MIKECFQLNEVLKFSDHFGQSLFLFDVDHTLVVADHPAFYRPNIEKYGDWIVEFFSNLKGEDFDRCIMHAALSCPPILIEENAPKIIEDLKTFGKVFGFTALRAGKIGDKKASQLRAQWLENLKIKFSDQTMVDEIIDDSDHDRPVIFSHGIIFSNGEQRIESKRFALEKFLQEKKLILKNIFMFDDRKKHLQDVENFLQKKFPQIKFFGLCYRGSEKFCPSEINFTDFKNFWTSCAKK